MHRIRPITINDRKDIMRELQEIKCDSGGIAYMAPKGVHKVLKVERVPVILANIVKQEMLSKGGEAAVAKGVVNFSIDYTDLLLMGTLKQYQSLIKKLKLQPFGAKRLAQELEETLSNLKFREAQTIKAGKKEIILGKKTLVMGILNATPDSFSDGGKYNSIDYALRHAEKMLEEGADIIDLGGESTRPNSEPVSLEEELRRVIPVVEKLAKVIDVPISIDTYKAEVAKQAIEAGADIINDVWGLRADKDMAKVVAQTEAPVIIMHNQKGTEYKDLIGDIIEFFEESIRQAIEAGVDESKIILDPGIGFGKDTEQNLEVMRRLEEFKALGKPVLLGTSRKRMIGNTLNLPVEERVEGTGATVAVGIAKGIDIVRVHDVKEIARVVKMTDAMLRR